MEASLKQVFDKLQRNLFFRRLLLKVSSLIRRYPAIKRILAKRLGKVDTWASYKNENEFAQLRHLYPTDYNALLTNKRVACIGFLSAAGDELIPDFVASCEELNVAHQLFDFKSIDLFDRIKQANCDVLLVRPSFPTAFERQAFFEKVWTIATEMQCAIYPSLKELSIYEAKRQLSYFVEAHAIPHPPTRVFLDKKQAEDYIQQCEYPQIFKAHNGASSSSVEILYNRSQAREYVNCLFDSYYVNKKLFDARDIDFGYLLLQKYIKNVREFRILKIGESWFGHEKSKNDQQEFMSGSGIMKWTAPPTNVLNFCREIALKHQFTTMCFDVFLDNDTNELFINELQTWFGSYNPSQMYVNDLPGRYVYSNAEWRFEQGLYNEHQSMKLRIVDIINTFGA
jgi:glutathione synthase/RimK-type ligase-like ATP-grasp enzyme